MKVIKGIPVFAGICIAPLAVLEWEKDSMTVSVPAIGIEQERERFHKARTEAISRLEAVYEKALQLVGEEDAAIFQVQQLMLEDEDFLEGVEQRIQQEGLSAQIAVRQTGAQLAALFQAMEDPYMQARAADVLDAAGRVEENLAGRKQENPARYHGKILAAEDLSPGELMRLQPERIGGFLLSGGNAGSHTGILIRNLEKPAVMNTAIPLSAAYDNELCIIDGFTGTVYLEPDQATLASMQFRQKAAEQEKQRLQRLRGQKTETLDGQRIVLYANAGSLADLPGIKEADAEGIGLFRSEFLYLRQDDYPTEEQQFLAYKAVLEAMPGKRVIIRTLDMGADKKIGYFALPEEANPALGLRGIRLCLARTELFKTQLRALCRASVYGDLAIMFPMIVSGEEVRSAKALLEEVKRNLTRDGRCYAPRIDTGIMIETPAAALVSEELAREVDFFSIGTNDLTQYTLAADRQNSQLARFIDPHHPAVLQLIRMAVENGHKAGIRVGLCGELGGDVSLTEYFLRIGLDALSVAPSQILALREKIRSLRLHEAI